jgi:hypothetical protein
MSISSWSLEVMCVVRVRLVAVGAVRVKEDHSGFSELAVGVGWLVVLGFGVSFFSTAMSIVAPLLSSSVRIVRRGMSVRATIMPTRLTNWIGWLL